ncbi:hypothetical protein NM688_g53 [Phlebia brevispora]|uniref:Uncharacterized protein n=1 Tax=Phlebia brevispora TaxID=194682 RepID=A0ACC1TF43_9APHY|nr:hypothetical protein NM688_g53 [Phlebia brevispora]
MATRQQGRTTKYPPSLGSRTPVPSIAAFPVLLHENEMDLAYCSIPDTQEHIHPYIREDLKNAKMISIYCYAKAVFNLEKDVLTSRADEIRDLNWFDDEIIRTSLAAYCASEEEVSRSALFAKLTNRVIELARGALSGVGNTYPVDDFCFVEHNRAVDRIEEHEVLGAVRRPNALGLRRAVAHQLFTKVGKPKKKVTLRWTDILLTLEFKGFSTMSDRFDKQRKKRGLVPFNPEGTKATERTNKKSKTVVVQTAEDKPRRPKKAKKMSPPRENILAALQERNQYPSLSGPLTPELVAVDMSIQVASYALELLSCTYGTRSHCLSMSIKDDKLFLWYHDASGIIYTEDHISMIDNFELFAALVVGFACCTPEQFGVLPPSVVQPHFPYPRNFPPPNLDESTLTITDARTKGDVVVTFDEYLFSQYMLVGKRTFLYTIETEPVLSKQKLIMKLSYQVTTRKEEHRLVDIAKKAGVPHLPEIHLWGDIWKLSDGAREAFLTNSDGRATYEDRVLRAIVYTRYSSIKPLFSENCLLIPVMVDQMLDCLHDLRYKANILHRDISVNNIMYEKKGNYYNFVLIDFDMAVELLKDGASSYTASSKHRTGTLPFMAYQLIDDAYRATITEPQEWRPKRHLLCHDLQSLFWVSLWCILVLFQHFHTKKGQENIINLLRRWESDDLNYISSYKNVLARHTLREEGIPLLGPPAALRSWLLAWTEALSAAEHALCSHCLAIECAEVLGKEVPPFDEETMGGTFSRQTLKDALTPYMPFKQISRDAIKMGHIEPPSNEEPSVDGITKSELTKEVVMEKPRRQTRKRMRPQDQVLDAENDIRARLRPRRKLT